jgi:alkanesulfonate monooxygenase SsuD/methylene tetrahydromethanopterin reductase-like flavin-dependent oxidoreductase (luciferase family)
MRYGFVIPGGTPAEQVELGVLAEASGWDAVFAWEAAYGPDPWSMLSAMAALTTTIRLGTMLTPLPWRRPWKVASQVATLDQLSGGRAILSVGTGATDVGTTDPDDVHDLRERAQRLGEGIDLIDALWSGASSFQGERWSLSLREGIAGFRPVQSPRPPIWLVGAWPHPASMRRVLRADGLLPNVIVDGEFRPPTPEDITAMIGWLDANGGRRPGFDVVTEGETPAGPGGAAVVAPWAAAGCTWWLEARWVVPEGQDAAEVVRERIAAGPPTA